MSLVALWPLAAIAGALIGSFLNVVIWRVPRRESLVAPASHCPNCGRPIRPYDNIPVLSWLLLRGRCRDCGTRISPRYPLVELGTAAVFALVLPWAATLSSSPATASIVLVIVAYLYLAAISIALTLIDLDVHRLPNSLVVPTYPVMVGLLAVVSLLEADPESLVRAAIGGAALLLVYGAMVLAYPGGMGLGDVKLAGVLGFSAAWIGWGSLAVAAFAPFLLGGLFGITMLIARRAGRKTRIPFGPWMLAGTWIGFVAGEPIAGAYLRLVGLA